MYDFSEHICSTEWIDSLPNGLVSKTVDLRYTHVIIDEVRGWLYDLHWPEKCYYSWRCHQY